MSWEADLSELSQLSKMLKQIAGTGERGDKIKVAIGRASRATGLSYWRTFDIWYEKARSILDSEKTAILEALTNKEILDERNQQSNYRMALAKMESRLTQMEAALARAASSGDVETIANAFGIIS